MANKISEVYASAFVELAVEDNKVVERKKQAQTLKEYLKGELMVFLRSNAINKEIKKDLINECFAAFDVSFRNLLCLLVDKGRSTYANEILTDFISKCNEHLGIKVAKVTSSRPLRDEEVTRLKKAIGNKYHCDVEIDEVIDKDLISGFKVKIDDYVIDTSMQNKMNNLKKELLKESW